MKKFFCIMVILFLPIFILLQIVEVYAFNLGFYEKKYKYYQIQDRTQKTIKELKDITSDLLNYLKYEDKELKMEKEYSKRDLIHLVDVKNLFQKGFILKNISLIISFIAMAVLFFKDIDYFYKSISLSSLTSLAILLLLFILSLIDFNKIFTYFHLVLFDNDYWILDPKKDLLIKLFPENFFMDIFTNIVLLFIKIMSILLIISYLLKETERHAKTK